MLAETTQALSKWDQFLLLATGYGVKVLGAFIFIIAAWILGVWLRSTVRKALERAKVEATLAKFLSNIARWTLMILSVVACLGIFDVQTASFAAVIGSAGLAVGLAMQGSLSHLAAGVMLLLTRPFKSGDTVVIAGQTGTVDEIELFATHIDTPDGRRVVIPNAQVFSSVIENITYHSVRRIDLVINVEYGADVTATEQALLRAARATPGKLPDRDGEAVVRQLGATGIEWQVSVWAPKSQFGVVRQSLITAAKSALEHDGLRVPLPPLAPHTPRA